MGEKQVEPSTGQKGGLLQDRQKELLKDVDNFDPSMNEVKGGVWNPYSDESRKETGVVGVYVVVGKPYKDGQGNMIIPQLYYRLREDGYVEISDRQVVRMPQKHYRLMEDESVEFGHHKVVMGSDDSFQDSRNKPEYKKLYASEQPVPKFKGTLERDNGGNVIGLSLRVEPKGERLDPNLPSSGVTLKK